MLKSGWIFLVLMTILVTSISCISCQTSDEIIDVPETETPVVLAPSPAETVDGSLVGDGWHQGQTPQSYNTGDNQTIASEEEVQRVTKELEELEKNQ